MKAVEFTEANVKIAEHQKDFHTVPAHYNPEEGSIIYCMELTDVEILSLVHGKKIWVKQLTGGRPMQPILMTTLKSELKFDDGKSPEYDGPEDGHNDFKEPKSYGK